MKLEDTKLNKYRKTITACSHSNVQPKNVEFIELLNSGELEHRKKGGSLIAYHNAVK